MRSRNCTSETSPRATNARIAGIRSRIGRRVNRSTSTVGLATGRRLRAGGGVSSSTVSVARNSASSWPRVLRRRACPPADGTLAEAISDGSLASPEALTLPTPANGAAPDASLRPAVSTPPTPASGPAVELPSAPVAVMPPTPSKGAAPLAPFSPPAVTAPVPAIGAAPSAVLSPAATIAPLAPSGAAPNASLRPSAVITPTPASGAVPSLAGAPAAALRTNRRRCLGGRRQRKTTGT